MFSIICVYNDKEILNNYLLKSLKNQTVEFELILLDNRKHKFSSAARALNHGAKQAHNKYLLFIHQDVEITSDDWLIKIEVLLDSMPNIGIAGVAGKRQARKGVITNIEHGSPPARLSNRYCDGINEVQTVDECLFVIPKERFELLSFDEQVCDDWHLYAVDYCLSAQKKGWRVCVIPMHVYHRSPGYSMSESYYKGIEKLAGKHRSSYRTIATTNGDWNTTVPIVLQRTRLWRVLINLFNIVTYPRRIKSE